MLRRLFESERGPQGPRWTKIAKSFSGRTPASVRNHWLRIKQGERDVAERNYKNHCTACGQPKRVGHRCVMLKVGQTAAASATATSAPPPPVTPPAPPAPMQHVEAPRPMQPHVPVTADEHHATVGDLFGEDVAQTTLDFLFPTQHVEAPRPMQPPVPLTADEHHATVGELFGEVVAQTLDFLF